MIKVLSRIQFEAVVKGNKITAENVGTDFEHTVFIEILDSNGGGNSHPAIVGATNEIPNFIALTFDDVTDEEQLIFQNSKRKITWFGISDIQAKQLYDFIVRNMNKKNWVIHCAAGVSRSGAIGEFINDFLGEDYRSFIRFNPQIMPNFFVKNKLTRLIEIVDREELGRLI